MLSFLILIPHMAHYYLPAYVTGEFIAIQTINIFTITREWDIRKSERKFYSALRRPPIRYSLAGSIMGFRYISEMGDYYLSPPASPQRRGGAPEA
jgi:hypothetical protein